MKRAALLLLLAVLPSFGQPDLSPPPPKPALPFLDPGTEIATWDGKNWNISNNRLFQARFEKYLSIPSDINQDSTEHFKALSKIRELLSPSKLSDKSAEEAFRLLGEAARYSADDLLSDAIANQVYSAWLSKKSRNLLRATTDALEKERERLVWNKQMVADGNGLHYQHSHHTGDGLPGHKQDVQSIEMEHITARLAEVDLLLKSNRLKIEISRVEARTEFQALIVELFLQRRFHHVLIATRFYRSIFTDGESQQLKFGQEAQNLFAKTTGYIPTLTSLDTLCGELIGEVNDSVKAFNELLAKKELESATKRLSEAFMIGECLTAIDTVSINDKHQALVFLQRSHQLLNALEVKDYTLAEKIVAQLQATATDFDTTAANAAIQKARTTSTIHLAKARNAAAAGDKKTLEAELNAATDIWPTNPELAEVAKGIYDQSNIHARATSDFDHLVSQRSWRQIYNERMRFIAAFEAAPEKQEKLQQIIDNIMMIDRTITRAQDLEKRGEAAGAWETTDIVYRQFPEYPRLIQTRAEFAVKAADYVQAIHSAEKLEAESQRGPALSWYLQALLLYPHGELAKAGIQRLSQKILPDSW